MTRHFVVIAPNITVFERLKEDFKPGYGGPDIFNRDPLIPVAWLGDWNLSVVLQDEATGAAMAFAPIWTFQPRPKTIKATFSSMLFVMRLSVRP